MSISENSHKYWMQKAIEEAKLAMAEGELPIGAVLVSGNKELSRAQTQVVRKNSILAHAEWSAVFNARNNVFTTEQPLTLYTTLEPCLMCIGAAIQAEVKKIIFAMPAGVRGDANLVGGIRNIGQKVPEIQGGILKDEVVELFKQFIRENPDSFAATYANEYLEGNI